MTERSDTQFDRFLARLAPPLPFALAIVLSLALAALLIFFPGLTERHELDSLAFGVTFCWMPAGIVWLVIVALRAKDNARRAWGWLSAAILVGLAGVLVVGGMAARGEDVGTRLMFVLVCPPLMLPLLFPAGYFLVKLWREVE